MTPRGRPGSDEQAERAERATAGRSFVITVWLEPTEEPTRPEWRWRVNESRAEEYRYFRSVSRLLAYLSERTGAPPPS